MEVLDAPLDQGAQLALELGFKGIGSANSAKAVCTEDSNPDVVMVKSAQNGVRTYEAGSLNRTRDRRILVQ
jgi:hypothetical protein